MEKYTITVETYDNRLLTETEISKMDFYSHIYEWTHLCNALDFTLTEDKVMFVNFDVEIWTFVHDNTIIHLKHYIYD